MGFRVIYTSAIDLPEVNLEGRVSMKAAEIRAAANRMSTTYEAQRRSKLELAETLRQLRFEVNDLRDEICLATKNTHVGTQQCREALLSATKRLTKAIETLESI